MAPQRRSLAKKRSIVAAEQTPTDASEPIEKPKQTPTDAGEPIGKPKQTPIGCWWTDFEKPQYRNIWNLVIGQVKQHIFCYRY